MLARRCLSVLFAVVLTAAGSPLAATAGPPAVSAAAVSPAVSAAAVSAASAAARQQAAPSRTTTAPRATTGPRTTTATRTTAPRAIATAPAALITPAASRTPGASRTPAALETPAALTPAALTPAAPDYSRNCPTRPAPRRYTCYSLHRNGLQRFAATPSGYGPADLQAAYAIPARPVSGTPTVYVIDAFGYPNVESDLARYRSQYSLPACTRANGCLRVLNQRGDTSPLPAYDDGWAQETALDLDMVSAVCPACHITLIQSDDNSDNLFLAVARANAMGAVYLSMSWGGPEDGTEPAYDTKYFNRTGVVYAVASGDGGYGAGPSYPSTSRHAVAVGGTSLRRNALSPRGWSETVWGGVTASDGTGSACSTDEAKPSWQLLVAGSVCPRRAGNDVSAVADPDTGVAVYQTGPGGGGWSVSGGTSASAPIIAGVYALAGRPAPGDHPASYPYTDIDHLNDVTSGSNGHCTVAALCTAAPGWDGPTGMGTPRGVSAFDHPAKVITMTNPDLQVSAVGSPVRLTVPVRESPSGKPVVSATGLPAGLAISAAGVVTGTPTTVGTTAVTITARDAGSASSVVRFSWAVGLAGTYVPVPATRLLDTRAGIGAPAGAVTGNHSLPVQVLGRGGLPSSGVSSVVVNLTVTHPVAAGYGEVYADGRSTPRTSNLNFVRGQTVANLSVAKVGTNGRVRVYTLTTADYVLDVTGYYIAGPAKLRGAFAAVEPARILDTRTGNGVPAGVVADRTSRTLRVAGRGGVPATGASAVLMNLTAVDTLRPGWVSAYPDPRARPATANVNFPGRATVPGLVLVPLRSDGTVTLFVFGGAHLVADVFGYVVAGSPAAAGGLVPLTASRVLDTRTGNGVGGAPITVTAGDTVSVKVTGRGGVPAGRISAAVLNVAVGNPTGGGFLTVYPDNVQIPATSNLNFTAGRTVSNLVVVPVSAQGYVALTVSGSGTAALVADVAGYVVADR